MSDERHEPPRPATWAGKRRGGEGEKPPERQPAPGPPAEQPPGDQPAEPPPAGPGMTEEFDGLAAELGAELGESPPAEPEEAGDEAGGDPDAPPEPEAEEAGGAPDAPPEPEPGSEPAAEPAAAEAGGAAEPGEPGATPDAPDGAAAGQETAEADTVAIADREAAQEAAHAGLRARVGTAGAAAGGPPPATAAAASGSAPVVPADSGEPPSRNVLWRFVAGGAVIVSAVAAATAVAFLLFLTDIGNALREDDIGAAENELASIEGDQPQTILILGSDQRGTPGDPGRSDTTMLLRVDPHKEFLALLSLPRDLRVQIPGYGTDKLNAAYSLGEQYQPKDGGGPALTLKTVKELLGIEINHIVNIDFEGFYDAVNAIGCVYVDVDRHYYNPVGGEYDDIDIKAGYTQLCGYRALDYVRYRHNDNDIVRGARQQAFVREARQQIPPTKLAPPPFGDGKDLIEIFTKYTTSDINDPPTIIEMLKSFVAVRNAPVRQVDLEGSFETINGGDYVIATAKQVQAAVDQFLGRDLPAEPAAGSGGSGGSGGKQTGGQKRQAKPAAPAMIDVAADAQARAEQFARELRRKRVRLPVFYPTEIASRPATSITEESRGAFQIPDPDGRIYRGYKFVVTFNDPDCCDTYYGVSGTNWKDPPILNNPSETREIDGREYLLFYDRSRLRLVGWKTSKGSYWVINTLTNDLSEAEMLAVATSTRETGG